MKKEFPFQFSLRITLLSTLAEGVLSIVAFLLIPGDPKNAWILGLSKSRLFMLIVAVLIVMFFGVQIIRLLRNREALQALDQKIKGVIAREGNLTTGFVLSLAGLVGGILFLNSTFTTTDMFLKGYYIRLAPWMLWFTLLSAQTLLFLVLSDLRRFRRYLSQHGFGLLTLLLILTAGLLVHTRLWDLAPSDWDVNKLFDAEVNYDIFKQDIHAVFTEGTKLLEGTNPYSRVHQLGDDLTWNFEIPTYFPVFYVLNWLTQKIGFRDFFYWLDLWKNVFLLANLGIAYLVFYVPYHRYHRLGFAILGSLFWLFSRWTLYITMIYHIDFIAIFFFILSLTLWPRHKKSSLVAFGLSLGVKQIAIFAFPLYLIWIWRDHELRSWKKPAFLTLILLAFPLLYLTPFLVWDAGGFVKSVLLSATRNAESHFGIPALDALLGMSGILAKVPMLLLIALTYFLAWTRRINHYTAAFLVMVIFVNFNSVLFRQYLTWVVPLLPLALCATLDRSNTS